MTENRRRKRLPFFVAASRRHHPANRMRFLFTMSSSQRLVIRQIAQSTLSLEDRASRRAIQPSRETAIFKLISFIGVSPLRRPSLEPGGARRDRTDDLMLAKHALSQLSYGPLGSVVLPRQTWWAWEDLNLRPHAYQARALTN
jgi:hypothetical protein